MTNHKTPVGIIGGGISGLSVAYALQKKGIPAAVYERRDEVGGVIRTQPCDQWLVEEGPGTLMVRSRAMWDLLDELELAGRVRTADKEAKKRYVVKNGSPVPVPSSPFSVLSTPLLSAKAKLRLLKEPFIPPSGLHDESVAGFFTRRLGEEPLEYGIDPFVSGIYAGDPRELSVKHTFPSLWKMERQHGSLLRGLLRRGKNRSGVKRALVSFDAGNQLLPQRLAQTLEGPVITGAGISSAEYRDGAWEIRAGSSGGTPFENRHDALVAAVPVYRLPGFLNLRAGREELKELATLPYAPLSILALGYKNEDIDHPLDGYGMLIPEKESLSLLGVLFSSTLFPGRSPEGHSLLTCFIGGARQPQLARKSRDELTALIQPELGSLLGIGGDPLFIRHAFREKAIPQYRVGHDRFLTLMGEIEEKAPGLFLQGNYREGVAVPECIASGFETSCKVDLFLQGFRR